MATNEYKFANDLIQFIDASPTAYQAVRNIKAALIKKGFKQLNRALNWNIEKGGKYFTSKNSSSIIAFTVGNGNIEDAGFKIIAAHTDSPSLKLKPEPEMYSEGGYLKLNVEVYGGPILSTWFDRPLSIAGRVVLSSENPLQPEEKFVNIQKPLFVIPNLAIHLNRSVNDNRSIDNQKELLPVFCLADNNSATIDFVRKYIADDLKISADQILDFDLFLYEYHGGEITGANNEFISSGRIDNLAMVHAGIDSLFNSTIGQSTKIMVCFDNEETGSRSKQGAESPFMKDVLKRISWALSKEKDAFLRAKTNSFGISADMAHAVHPAFPEKHDPVAKPVINKGPVIKINANQKYTSDAISSSIFEMFCKRAGVPVQKYVNHSNVAGGSTLGNVLSTQIDIRMVDVGNPMLAMHSIREFAGVKDHYYIKKVFDEFYK